LLDVLTVALGASILAIVLVPLYGVVKPLVQDGSFGHDVRTLIRSGLLRDLIKNTALVVFGSTAVSVVVACFFAWINERTDAGLGWMSRIFPVLSMLVPTYAAAVGWILLTAPGAGLLNNVVIDPLNARGIPVPSISVFSWTGVILLYSAYMIPQVYLVVGAALRQFDPGLEEAARISGSGPIETLVRVTLPSIAPAIASGALLAVMYGVGMFAVPALVGTQAHIEVITPQIVRYLTSTYPPQTGQALALALVLVIAVAALWALNVRIARAGRYFTIGGRQAGSSRIHIGRGATVVVRFFMVVYLFLTCVLPLAALVFVSLQPFWSGRLGGPLTLHNYTEVFASTSIAGRGLRNSVVLGIACATIAVVLLIPVGYRIVSGTRNRFWSAVDGVMKLPAAIPSVVVATGILLALGGPPAMLGGTLTILMIAYIVLHLPQASAAVQSSLLLVGRDLIEASRTAGNGSGKTLGRIALPLSFGGAVAGWVLLFVMTVNDLTASVLLAGPHSPVVGFVVISMFENGTYPGLAALAAAISIASTVVVLFTLSVASRRRRW
jgi:iron(III) transport system permease protein